MKHFIKFFVVWFSQNLAIPFWVVGHVHLSLNIYDDLIKYGSSALMHILVAIGFFIDWKESKKQNEKERN